MLLYIYFFQQLSEMGVIILPFHRGQTVAQKGKLLAQAEKQVTKMQ